ncbi:DNA polymerase epsilon subunit D [Nakaseomyces bracarensis]|uniref:DNA polymerase epsilon subunit D n=1 Tax=Nakaseomyces bracarensis TaxID=273131 RepID=A0ABR4NWG1_9SACH
MPPKGWRKDAQGNYPTTSYMKEQEKVTMQDLLFPRSVIVSLAKEVPEMQQQQVQNTGANGSSSGNDKEAERPKKLVITKDASTALQHSATVFVNHLLMYARELAKEQDRRSCNVDDILNSLEHMGHPGLKPLVANRLEDYKEALEWKKQLKAQLQILNGETFDDRENNIGTYDHDNETEDEEEPEKKPKLDTPDQD